jgi:hypothetical protein
MSTDSPFDEQPQLVVIDRPTLTLRPDQVCAHASCELSWSQGDPGFAKVAAKFRLELVTLADAEEAGHLVPGAAAYWDRRREDPEAPSDHYQIPRCDDSDPLCWVLSLADAPVVEVDAPIRSLTLSGSGETVTLTISVAFIVPIGSLIAVDGLNRQPVGINGMVRQLPLLGAR